MDLHQLLAKMVELDRPTTEATSTPVVECPPDMGAPMNSPMPTKPDTPPPSMSLNLNAQGMDNIENLMKLMTKVNPDMINQPATPAPSLSAMPSLTPPGPSISSIGDLGNLDKGPLKMLPDLDSDDGKEGPEEPEDNDKIDVIDLDNDEKDDDKEEPEDDEKKEWANSLGDSEPEVKDVDYMNNKLAGGMNRPKGTHPKVAGGDNPMQRPRMDTRESIRTELLQRLAEAKGAK
jgi:hypothetical protein